MDELRMIRDLLPAPEPPAAAEVAAARRRVFGARRDVPANRRPTKLAALTASAAAAAVAGVLVVTSGPAGVTASGPVTGAPAGGGTGPVALSAHTLLLTAATTAGQAPATGRYWHVDTRSGAQIVTPAGYLIDDRSAGQLWVPSSAGGPTWRIIQLLGAAPVTPADRRAWVRDGSPAHWSIPPRRLTPAEQRLAEQKARIAGLHYRKPSPELIDAAAQAPAAAREDNHGAVDYIANKPYTLGQLAALPTDPARLAALLRTELATVSATPPSDTDVFLEAVHLALYVPVSPAVRAASFRLLAELPGVRLVGSVRDPLGRAGQAIAISQGDYDWRLVLDTRTGTPLALETITTTPRAGDPHQARAGQVSSYDALVSAGWTDAQPVLPSRRLNPAG